jgi:hypothetical protein
VGGISERVFEIIFINILVKVKGKKCHSKTFLCEHLKTTSKHEAGILPTECFLSLSLSLFFPKFSFRDVCKTHTKHKHTHTHIQTHTKVHKAAELGSKKK